MSLSDPIADMLTRLRNAAMARHEEVEIPSSRMKVSLAKALKKEGYISGFKEEPDSKQGILRLSLKYGQKGSVITGIKRESKPSRRIYVSHDEIPKVLNGLGISILSTPLGVMSDRDAREKRVGGEILCTVW